MRHAIPKARMKTSSTITKAKTKKSNLGQEEVQVLMFQEC